ncbi:carboxypeptidase regulatory-like domain-containing protein [Bacillus solitudinis]|uniref:carboxypeptidase regulatory-like domain-containing protein n=1 Tax=Bacillus solitudinis TaxID=2014074 RepID=UPI000C24037B|nr:carboxypeptidase regulatory-like domain-containing protein [Bacillus solitudinis]
MSYQPKSYRKFLATSLTAAVVASAVAVPVQNVEAASKSFSDVGADFWAATEIANLVDLEIINGYPDGTFKPSQSIIRGQAAAMIASALKLEVSETVEVAPFADLSKDSYHAPVAQAMKDANIMNGYADGTFGNGDTLTRMQMASILVNAFGFEANNKNVTINDLEKADASHRANIEILAQNGITNVNDFRPKEPVSRAQFATFIDRALVLQYTQEVGLTSVNFVNDTTVEVTFNQELDAADVKAEDFVIEGLEVKEATLKASEASASNASSTVVLTTSKQVEDTQYKLSYKGNRTSLTFTSEKVEVEAATAVTGFVRDGSTAVEGVTVKVGNKSTVTDKEGFFHLANLTEGEQEVTFSKTGFEPKAQKVTLVKDEAVTVITTGLSALSKANISVQANVVNKVSGAAITEATVAVEKFNQTTEKWEVLDLDTDLSFIDGKIDIANAGNKLNFGDKLRLQVSKDYTANLSNALKATDWIEFTLKADGETNVLAGIQMSTVGSMNLTGVAKNPAGTVVEAATVEIHNADGKVAEATTNANGEYSFSNVTLPTGTYSVKVDNTTDALYLGQVSVTEGQNADHNVNLVQGNALDFTVAAQGVNEVLNTTGLKAELVQNGAVIAEGTVDGSKFSFERIPAGSYTVKVTGDFVLPTEYALNVTNSQDVITEGDRVTLAGNVAVTTEAGSTVKLLQGSEVVAETNVNHAGVYSFKSVEAGDYKVEVSKSGKVTKTNDVTVAKNATATSDVTLADVATTANVSGVVRAEGTLAAVAGGTVSFYAVSVEGKEAGEFVASTTIESSAYSQELTPGAYQVVIRANGAETKATNVTVEAGDNLENRNHEVVVGGNAQVKFSFVDAAGQAVVVNADSVTLTDAYADADSTDAGKTVTGDAAELTFNNLAAGTYRLAVTAQQGKVDHSSTVSIAKGEEKAVEVKLQNEVVAEKSNVNLLVVNENNVNATGLVAAFDKDGKLVELASLTSGNATLALVDGSYDVRVFVNGYNSVKRDVTIAENTVNVPVIQLQK